MTSPVRTPDRSATCIRERLILMGNKLQDKVAVVTDQAPATAALSLSRSPPRAPLWSAQTSAGKPAEADTKAVRPFLEDPELNKVLHSKCPWPELGTPRTSQSGRLLVHKRRSLGHRIHAHHRRRLHRPLSGGSLRGPAQQGGGVGDRGFRGGGDREVAGGVDHAVLGGEAHRRRGRGQQAQSGGGVPQPEARTAPDRCRQSLPRIT